MKKIILLILLLPSLGAFSQMIEIDNPNNLIISPNPCKSFTTIHFELKKSDTTTLKVFNRWGENLKTFFNKTVLPKGIYKIQYDSDSIKTGVYYLGLTINSTTRGASISKIDTMLEVINPIKVDTSNRITISPNPCESFTRINFSLEKSDTVTLQIFNTLGVAIHTVFKKDFLPIGNYDIYYNTDTLKTGLYIVSLNVAGTNFASKFVKVNTLTVLSKASDTKDLKVFPNPLKNNLTIDYSGPKKVEIRSMEGKIVLQIQTNSTTIDLSSLPNATYVIQVWNQSNEIIASQKIVKGD